MKPTCSLSLNQSVTLRNRIVLPPMASQTADKSGKVTLQTLEHYKRLLLSRPGLSFVEYTYVDRLGKSEPNQLSIAEDDDLSGLTQLAAVFRKEHCPVIIQLTHAGAKISSDLVQGKLFAPSSVAVPVKNTLMPVPRPASDEQIVNVKTDFLKAAGRAKKAGFQGVEIHSAHGYGLNQWLSPLTNHRTDSYGGSLFNRARLLVEIVEMIKRNYPEMILSVRFPGQDYLEGGMTLEDSALTAKLLESAGVDLLNISSGIGGWRRPQNRKGEGYLVEEAKFIKARVNIPVIGVGGIKSKDYIQSGLTQELFDLAAVGRAILENPLWGGELGL